MKNTSQVATILKSLEIKLLNPMQETALDAIAKEADTVLLSPTGSGKTLAFLLPIYLQLQANIKSVQCLVIAPSRELALQIEQVWRKMATGYKINTLYGGHSIDVELNNLSTPPAILIGTPGRVVDHIERKSFDLSSITTLVLDEFDKSLQLGFHEDMEFIISQLPNLSKRILISATSDINIPEFVGIEEAKILDFTSEQTNNTKLELKLVKSPEKDKIDTLFNLICSLNSESALIFCNYRELCERISDALNDKGIYNVFYHGGMDQEDRERVLIQFRNRSVRYLVTTDLAARGLDIEEVKNVINYQLPLKESEFVHRNGRTARMQASGTSYILQFIEDPIAEYLPKEIEEFTPNTKGIVPLAPEFKTLYISGGKKNKISKGDIAGFFIKTGGLEKEDIGMIEVKDFVSFVAVKSNKTNTLLKKIRNEKMKSKKYKIEIARGVIRE